MKRRDFLRAGVAGGAVAGVSGASAGELTWTPSEIEGPFYPVVAQKDKDFDLTKVEGKEGVAKGRVVFVSGVVVDTDGAPVEEATVDLWQANAAGRYRHPHDSNPAPLDPNFQGWAIVPSGVKGEFNFKTVVPGAYPASEGWVRPPHIHFKVSKKGYVELTTQMYFPGEELNEKDRLLKRKSEEEQEMMVAKLIEDNPETFHFRIVLEKA
ncbi:MAG: protocatechuate 3,4-dioxygenase [Luteolibacter sp.]